MGGMGGRVVDTGGGGGGGWLGKTRAGFFGGWFSRVAERSRSWGLRSLLRIVLEGWR